MKPYICVIECQDNHVYIGDCRRLYRPSDLEKRLDELVPKRIMGIYNVEQNYALFRLTNRPASQHLTSLAADIETTQADLVETILSDRYYYDKRDNEWYKVRTSNVKQNRWMSEVTTGYRESTKPGDYAAYHRVSRLKAEEVDHRPICSHGFPCEPRYSRYTREMYFDCPMKYVWPDFMPEVERSKPCDFRQAIPIKSWPPIRNPESPFQSGSGECRPL